MARDPFAPVTQPSVPSWVWWSPVSCRILLIGAGSLLFMVVSRRQAPQATVTPQVKGTAPDVPTRTASTGPAGSTATASVGAPAPDKAPAKATDDKDDGTDAADGRRHHGGHHKHGGKAVAAKESGSPAAPAAPAAKPKKKVDMSQKEIDNLLGI